MVGERRDELQFVVFRVGGDDEFALPIRQVQEVVRYAPPRAIASEVGWMRGVMSLRGSVLPVIDLAARLGIDSGGEPTRLLIADAGPGQGHVALAAGAVEEIAMIDTAAIDVTTDWQDAAVTGIAQVDGRIVVALDAARLCGDAASNATDPVLEGRP